MKWSRFATALLAACLIVGCVSTTTLNAANGEAVDVTLDVKQDKVTVSVDSRLYRLSLEQIIDSRCPANAKCIWAGELAARIAIEPEDQPRARREITLGESTVPSMEVSGLKLDLVAIDETSVTFTVQAAAAN